MRRFAVILLLWFSTLAVCARKAGCTRTFAARANALRMRARSTTL